VPERGYTRVTTIDPRQPLAAALQAQLAAVRERARSPQSGEAKAPAASGKATASVLAQRLQAISREDPDRRHKAVRLYLESELSREFGPALLNDPAFPQLLDAVQQQMRADGQTAAAVDALGDLLLAGEAG
jgi:hypothetical protein